jgi:hypothetical protein
MQNASHRGKASRRDFLQDVGRGALLATLGPVLVSDLGLGACRADEPAHRLVFGDLEPLVAMIQETPIERFVPKVVDQIKRGTPASKLVAAAGLANARALGGQDYVGFHALMTLAPAYAMAGPQPTGPQLLPILKVLYRTAKQIQDQSRHGDVLQPIEPGSQAVGPSDGEHLRSLIRQAKMAEAEQAFARMSAADAENAFNELQLAIQDDLNVHRVVLVWRAWELLPLTGPAHAHTMLRQSVRFCVDAEQERLARNRPEPAIRKVLPKLMDQYKLDSWVPGQRQAVDAWVKQLADTIYGGTREQAAEATAGALKEGFATAAIAEAISLAANRLVLNDPGRPAQWASPNKPVGSVHGDSIGVHASDAANAWRNLASVGNRQTAVTSLVVGAFHTGGQAHKAAEPHPRPAELESVQQVPAERLLAETEAAIRAKDQRRASAAAQRYGDLGMPAQPMFDMLRQFAVTEDGALHGEKYYETVVEEFRVLRPAFRWSEVVALARVTASAYGYPAPGVDEAAKLLT